MQGLTPLHMAALGAAEDVAFLLISQFCEFLKYVLLIFSLVKRLILSFTRCRFYLDAKASTRDYSGRQPVNYLPDNEPGNRMKSKLQLRFPEQAALLRSLAARKKKL